MIEINAVVKSYTGVTALKGINLKIKKKEFFGLLGPNGAGKTTLMSLLCGYINPDKGKIIIDGENVSIDNLELRKKIGLIPQTLALYDDLSAEENLEIFGSFFYIEKRKLNYIIKEKLDSLGLFERRKDKVKGFSGGMKRRLNLAASLLHDPLILLCDEPTVGVDPQSRNAIFDYLQSLNEKGMTIIYTTHYMEEAERLCTRVAIIDIGNIIAEGTIEDLVQKLPFENTIVINKDHSTIHCIDSFKEFGTIINEQDRFELKPDNNIKLSEFYGRVEQLGINYRIVNLKKPSLEALFLHLTGRSLRD